MGNQNKKHYIETQENSQWGSSVDGNLKQVQKESTINNSKAEGVQSNTRENVADKKDELPDKPLKDRFDEFDIGGLVLEQEKLQQPTEQNQSDVRPDVKSKGGETECIDKSGYVISDKQVNNEWTKTETKYTADQLNNFTECNKPQPVTNENIIETGVTDVAKDEFKELCTHVLSIQKANREMLKRLNSEENDRKHEEERQLQRFSDLEKVLENMEVKCRKKDELILQLTKMVEQVYNRLTDLHQNGNMEPYIDNLNKPV